MGHCRGLLFLLLNGGLLSCGVYAIRPFRAIDVLNPNEVRLDEAASKDNPMESTAMEEEDTEDDDVIVDYIMQPLDHFNDKWNETVQATLMQRYFYSVRYAKQPEQNAPEIALLCVGGEGPPLDKSVLINSVHCSGDMLELAKILYQDYHAVVHLYALEHRYYGDSYPVFQNGASPLANDQLLYLSSRQALQDLARFVASRHHDVPWITFGGSYPGFLAAWARQAFPHLIHAAVSSSAPIDIRVDFPQYKNHQGWDLAYTRIGGNQACQNIVAEGHKQIMQSPQEDIASLFGLCNQTALLDPDNFNLFVGDGVIDVPAQGNDPTCDNVSCNLDKLCQTLSHAKDKGASSMEALAHVLQQQQQETCLVVDWQGTLRYLARSEGDAVRRDGMRSWLYQTCTEFGWYQTCHANTTCPFGRGRHDLSMDYRICGVAYNISREAVQENVQTTRDMYYDDLAHRATRILSVQGDVDPWSELTIQPNAGMPLHWVKGASHHYWTHPVLPTDDWDIQHARNIIHKQVIEWLDLNEAPFEWQHDNDETKKDETG